MDLYPGRITGWQVADNMEESLVGEPLEQVLWKRRVKPGMVIHSGRGGQYLSRKVEKPVKSFK